MNIQMIVTYVVIDSFCIIMACVMGAHLNSDFGSESEVKARGARAIQPGDSSTKKNKKGK